MNQKSETVEIQEKSQEGWLKRILKKGFKKLLDKVIFILFKFPFLFLWEAFLAILFRLGPIILVLLFYKNVAPWIVKKWGDQLHPFLKWILFYSLPFCLVLGGCTSSSQKLPEMGTGTDDLKKSVCAQCTQKPFYKNGQWLIERKRP